jgi:hypothetical protein
LFVGRRERENKGRGGREERKTGKGERVTWTTLNSAIKNGQNR